MGRQRSDSDLCRIVSISHWEILDTCCLSRFWEPEWKMRCDCQVMSIFLTYNALCYNPDVMKCWWTVSYTSNREWITVINRRLSAWTCPRSSLRCACQGALIEWTPLACPGILPALVQVEKPAEPPRGAHGGKGTVRPLHGTWGERVIGEHSIQRQKKLKCI